MYASAEESREDIVAMYRDAWRHGEGTRWDAYVAKVQAAADAYR